MARTTRVRDWSFSTPSTQCASISSVTGKRYPRMLSRISASLRQRTDIARSPASSGRSDATRPASICGMSDACLPRVFRLGRTGMLQAQASYQATHSCMRAPALCATRLADEPVLLARLAEEASDRLYDDINIIERHVRIERQRNRAFADPFRDGEIAAAVAVPLDEVGH